MFSEVQEVELVPIREKNAMQKRRPDMSPPQLVLAKEAEVKLRTLAECLDFEDESAVVNELFYQFVLNQDPDTRRMIMSAYQLNVKGATETQIE